MEKDCQFRPQPPTTTTPKQTKTTTSPTPSTKITKTTANSGLNRKSKQLGPQSTITITITITTTTTTTATTTKWKPSVKNDLYNDQNSQEKVVESGIIWHLVSKYWHFVLIGCILVVAIGTIIFFRSQISKAIHSIPAIPISVSIAIENSDNQTQDLITFATQVNSGVIPKRDEYQHLNEEDARRYVVKFSTRIGLEHTSTPQLSLNRYPPNFLFNACFASISRCGPDCLPFISLLQLTFQKVA
jgi:hypothetical protein